MANKCPKCHSDNTDTARFCSNCATSLAIATVAQPSFTETLETPVQEFGRGTVFAGRFEVIEELGKGGMGKVFKVFDLHVLGHGFPVEVEPAGDLMRPQPLSLKFLDQIDLVHSEHVSSL